MLTISQTVATIRYPNISISARSAHCDLEVTESPTSKSEETNLRVLAAITVWPPTWKAQPHDCMASFLGGGRHP